MKVKVIQPHPYAGVQRTIGEEYDMEERFFNVMAAMGHVVKVEEPVLHRRDLEAESPKKQYRRRDLRAD